MNLLIDIVLIVTLTLFVAAFGWLVRVAYWTVPILGYWAKRALKLLSFVGDIAHFTGHVIGGYFADQNFRIVYRAHPKFSYAAGYLVPATYQPLWVSRSSVTKEDTQVGPLLLNLRRTSIVVLMPFPFILLLMGVFYVLFSALINVTGLETLKFVHLWIQVSLAFHWLPDDQDITSIYNALLMLHIGSLLLGFAGVCGALFIISFTFYALWSHQIVVTAITTYTPFSPSTFGFLVSMLFLVATIVLVVLHLKFKDISGKGKQMTDNAWLNSVYLWKIKHSGKLYSPVTTTTPSTVSKDPFRIRRLVWTGLKLLLLIVIGFITIFFILGA